MYIEQVTTATADLLSALENLIPQLTRRNRPPTWSDLEALIGSTSSLLIVGREPDAGGSIVAAGCLVVYRVTTGVRAIVEDVVVDAAWRGHGLGESLLQRLVDLARDRGAAGVFLTSNPARDAANKLYLKAGFTRRRTNSYYYALS
jgi:ribosomal protein S18 acetylase RimI-like enzyme